MKIGLIGCGKVGTSLLYSLRKNNQIVGVFDINKKNERTACKILSIKKNPSYRNLLAESEAIFLATPDDQILPAYRSAKKYLAGGKFIFHFSGLLSADIFPKAKNIYRGSVHPFATFPKLLIPPPRRKYFLFIEGDEKAKHICRKIFSKRNFILREIEKQEKPIYHLIGVFASNLLVGLIDSIHELMGNIAWHRKEFDEVVYPMILETLKNVRRYGTHNALSGPLARGDVGTIKRHLKVLKKNKNLHEIYTALSTSIYRRAIKGRKY